MKWVAPEVSLQVLIVCVHLSAGERECWCPLIAAISMNDTKSLCVDIGLTLVTLGIFALSYMVISAWAAK